MPSLSPETSTERDTPSFEVRESPWKLVRIVALVVYALDKVVSLSNGGRLEPIAFAAALVVLATIFALRYRWPGVVRQRIAFSPEGVRWRQGSRSWRLAWEDIAAIEQTETSGTHFATVAIKLTSGDRIVFRRFWSMKTGDFAKLFIDRCRSATGRSLPLLRPATSEKENAKGNFYIALIPLGPVAFIVFVMLATRATHHEGHAVHVPIIAAPLSIAPATK